MRPRGASLWSESRSHHDFLSACQVILYHSPQPLRGALATLYHILLGQTPLLPPLLLPQKISPMEEQPTTAASPIPAPKQSPRPERQHPLPEPVRSMPIGGATPKATLGGTPAPRGERPLPGSKHSNPAMPRLSAGTLPW